MCGGEERVLLDNRNFVSEVRSSKIILAVGSIPGGGPKGSIKDPFMGFTGVLIILSIGEDFTSDWNMVGKDGPPTPTVARSRRRRGG